MVSHGMFLIIQIYPYITLYNMRSPSRNVSHAILRISREYSIIYIRSGLGSSSRPSRGEWYRCSHTLAFRHATDKDKANVKVTFLDRQQRRMHILFMNDQY